MAKSFKRTRRIGDLIHQQLALVIKREISDPRLASVSITSVKMTEDLGTARVFFTVLDVSQHEEASEVLVKASGFLRSALAQATDLRYVPSLRFIYDASIAYGADLSQLIDRLVPDSTDSVAVNAD